MLLRFADNIFNEQVTCTLNVDQRTKQIKVDSRVIKLQIWDTAGQERFFSLSKAYLRGAQGCIAVYDITRRDSFQKLESQILDFLAYTKDQSNLGAGILVGGHGSRATAVARRGIQSDRGYKVETAHKKRKEMETPRDSEEVKGKSAVEGAGSADSDGFKYRSGEHKSEVDPLENNDFITAQSGVDIDELMKQEERPYHNVILVGTKLDLVK